MKAAGKDRRVYWTITLNECEFGYWDGLNEATDSSDDPGINDDDAGPFKIILVTGDQVKIVMEGSRSD